MMYPEYDPPKGETIRACYEKMIEMARQGGHRAVIGQFNGLRISARPTDDVDEQVARYFHRSEKRRRLTLGWFESLTHRERLEWLASRDHEDDCAAHNEGQWCCLERLMGVADDYGIV